MILENIDIDIDMVILENIDIDIHIDKAILQNIDIDKISNRFKFGISNRTTRREEISHAICRFSDERKKNMLEG